MAAEAQVGREHLADSVACARYCSLSEDVAALLSSDDEELLRGG